VNFLYKSDFRISSKLKPIGIIGINLF